VTFTGALRRNHPPVARPLFTRGVQSLPLVIAHRGASGYRPEHTLESYRLAIRLGADYIEPDLVASRDGVLVARHENEMSGTTNVASHPEFAGRRTTKVIDGLELTGWFTEDFTLRELRTLRAVERLPGLRPQNAIFDGRCHIPTFQEIIDLVVREERRLGRPIGIYPETKHPSYFAGIGLALEEPLVDALLRNELAERRSAVLIQSFEQGNLRKLHDMTDVRLIQLLDEPITQDGLRSLAAYAWGIGADKDLIVPRNPTGRLQSPTKLVQHAHEAGLAVHAWTFRAENRFLPLDYRLGPDLDQRGDGIAEYELFLSLGVDGVFSDHPDTAVAAVNAMWRSERPVGVSA
jgi:glycerophosphoryl diester phosphodiesterase